MTDERNENEENFSEKEEQFVEEQVMTEDPPRDEPDATVRLPETSQKKDARVHFDQGQGG